MNSPSHEITYIKHAASASSKTTGGKQALNKGLSYKNALLSRVGKNAKQTLENAKNATFSEILKNV